SGPAAPCASTTRQGETARKSTSPWRRCRPARSGSSADLRLPSRCRKTCAVLSSSSRRAISPPPRASPPALVAARSSGNASPASDDASPQPSNEHVTAAHSARRRRQRPEHAPGSTGIAPAAALASHQEPARRQRSGKDRPMKAVCWYGTHDVRVATVPDPAILNPQDAIIRVSATAICGSDLPPYDGYTPGTEPRATPGH